MSSKEITSRLYLKEFSHADRIIRYLLNPDDESIVLTQSEKEKFDLLKLIHGYRARYTRKADIISILINIHGVGQRQAYNLINETEHVFGSVNGVHKDYERNFLLEASRKNVELAMASRNSLAISKALTAHYKFAGLADFIPDMPDFAALEQHNYIISLPPAVLNIIVGMVKGGSLNLADFIPAQDISTLGIEEANELNEGEKTDE
jgi:hypothetical protein